MQINRRRALTGTAAMALAVSAKSSAAQAIPPKLRIGLQAQEPQIWKMGLRFSTTATCTNVFASFPVPMDWPEQKVELIDQNVDPLFRNWKTAVLAGGAKQVVIKIPLIRSGSSGEISFVFRVSRSIILPPEKTDDLVAPKKISRDLKVFTGNSMQIDASHSRIRAVSRELEKTEHATAWDQVEAIYDFVRETVTYTEGDLKNASEALKDGTGDCEEMTSLVVALCRNAKIPSRMVWIPDHCYPEFYLEDGEGNGHWFPCQAAGTRQFGRMDEERPVLQKGDRFKVPEQRAPVRYVSEYFKCDLRGNGKPRPTFIMERVVEE